MLKSQRTSYDYSSSCYFYVLAIVVTLIAQALAGLVASALAQKYPQIAQSGDFNTAFMIVIQAFNAAFIFGFGYLKRKSFNFSTVLHRQTKKPPDAMCFVAPIILAAMLMTGLFLPTTWYGKLIILIGVPESSVNIDLTTASSIAMLVIASVFLAPVFEEIIYRGVLFNGLKQNFTPIKAALLCALAFMLMHMNPAQVVFQFALGFVAAMLVHKSGRLLPAIIMHAVCNTLAIIMQLTSLNNALQGCVTYLERNPVAAVFITLGMLVAAAAVIFVVLKFAFGKPEKGSVQDGAGIKAESRVEIANGVSADAKVPMQEQSAPKDGINASDDAAYQSAQAVLEQVQKKDGTFKFIIGISVSTVVLIINLITSIVS